MKSPVKLATVTHAGRDQIVLVVGDGLVPLADVVDGLPATVRELIAAWPKWDAAVTRAAVESAPTLSTDDVVWQPPLIPGKIICAGMNFYDHIAEMSGLPEDEIPEQPFPFNFLKPQSALVGSGATVVRPSYGVKLDWEVELTVVVGNGAAATSDHPLDAVFGYTIMNDLSMRDFSPFPHYLGMDATVMKGFDGAAPLGPWITPAANVPDPQAVPMRTTLNGEVMQDGSTAKMIFSVVELLRHLGRVFTLEPGDVIATGTPAGCGVRKQPPRFLRGGDEVIVELGELGELGSLRTLIANPPDTDLLLPDRA